MEPRAPHPIDLRLEVVDLEGEVVRVRAPVSCKKRSRKSYSSAPVGLEQLEGHPPLGVAHAQLHGAEPGLDRSLHHRRPEVLHQHAR